MDSTSIDGILAEQRAAASHLLELGNEATDYARLWLADWVLEEVLVESET